MNRRQVIGYLAAIPFLGWLVKPADSAEFRLAEKFPWEAETAGRYFSRRLEEKAKSAGLYDIPLKAHTPGSGCSGATISYSLEHGHWLAVLYVFWHGERFTDGLTQTFHGDSEQGVIGKVRDSDMDQLVQKSLERKAKTFHFNASQFEELEKEYA